MSVYRKIITALSCCLLALGLLTNTVARELNVTIENLSPANGINLTPFWVGFHDGSFDLYDRNQPISTALERLAEDGVNESISTLFVNSNIPGVDATISEPGGFAGAPVFDPGSSATLKIEINELTARYFSYASMIIPSNDAFIANGDPVEHEVFNAAGEFVGPISFIVWGNQVLDAGSEENTEINAAFLNQSSPNTGNSENGTIKLHEGFIGSIANTSVAPANILGGTNAAGAFIDPTNADFKQLNYQVARITISEPGVPVRVNVTNLSYAGGLYNTPLWVGFHNGEFDIYSRGEQASAGLERIAEDGDSAELSNAFSAAATTGFDGVITEPDGFVGAPVFDPGSKAQQVFLLDSSVQRYFSYATMIIPSNDAFVANGDPKAHQLFDETGTFSGPVNIHIMGSSILDAGSEENTESDAAFLNQASPNAGQTENAVVADHPGFNGSLANPGGSPQNILGGTTPAGTVIDPQLGDFSSSGSQILRISVNRAVDWSFSGVWYDPARDGEGFLMAVSGDVNPVATLTWFTFSTDGTGLQVWMIGTAAILGETAIFDMFRAEGGVFGAGFSSTDANKPYWGQIRVDFSDCNNIVATYDAQVSDFGTGTVNLQRLSPVLSNVTGACQ